MPELAEVEFYRRRWHEAAAGRSILSVELNRRARVWRGTDVKVLLGAVVGARLKFSATSGKQMLFRFGRELWLGIHLGMTGELSVKSKGASKAKHDHLILRTARHTLVFNDPRMFGRLRCELGTTPPEWWTRLAPPLLSPEFTVGVVAAFLRRRARAPIKAVLLMQERFPGIGNWMADEILWRAGIHPRRKAGSLSEKEVRVLWGECRRVCRMALRTIAGTGGPLPSDLNVNIPNSWLFHHRWRRGGICPRSGTPLAHAEIGGRTTCWSPARQG